MIYLLGVVITLMTIGTDLAVGQSESECGRPPVVWRNNNMTCPPRAVCGDVFIPTHDSRPYEEVHVENNCICPGNQVCPYGNSSHLLYASILHMKYTCEPRCTLPWCDNIPQQQQLDNVQRPTNHSVVALTHVSGEIDYDQMNCRCPRHHFPLVSRGERLGAVKADINWGVYNFMRHYLELKYICSTDSRDEPREDPCN